MALYKVKVRTGDSVNAGTLDSISITLVGSERESAKTPLDHVGKDFLPGHTDEYCIREKHDLGQIILIRLHKDPFLFFPENSWFCSHVTVESPSGLVYHFPCYHWVEGYLTLELPEGKATLAPDRRSPHLLQQIDNELKNKHNICRWKEYHPGFPRCIDVANSKELNSDAKYSLTKALHFDFNRKISAMELTLKGFVGNKESWSSFDDLKRVFSCHKTAVSEYVSQHWREDSFFGYQFLNGVDPTVIRKCHKIPENFPVTDQMVASSLGASTALVKELKNGNLFIVDHKILDGIPANVMNGQQQYMAAALCLLHRTPQDKLMPIAIQINQTPGPENPIFLPSDSECDWMLAKMWVRGSNFAYHQAVSHFLRTHAFAEVFCIATFRHLPMSHPLYKLLIPHLRYTLQINQLARETLIGPGGTFDNNTALGVKGLAEVITREMKSMTYTSICFPENIKSRGMESMPNFYYRDDGMKIWSAIESFVTGIVDCYYKGEESIKKDHELQAWVLDIFKEGFLENHSSGVPSSLETRAELIKYLTTVIFTCSAEHAAVNSAQFDFIAWMPNGISTMRQPPPTKKGTATMESIWNTLPNVGSTAAMMVTVRLLSNEPGDMRPLGTFPEEHFTEEKPKRCIKAFQERLCQISAEIERRNESLTLQYTYLNPKVIENSVSI